MLGAQDVKAAGTPPPPRPRLAPSAARLSLPMAPACQGARVTARALSPALASLPLRTRARWHASRRLPAETSAPSRPRSPLARSLRARAATPGPGPGPRPPLRPPSRASPGPRSPSRRRRRAGSAPGPAGGHAAPRSPRPGLRRRLLTGGDGPAPGHALRHAHRRLRPKAAQRVATPTVSAPPTGASAAVFRRAEASGHAHQQLTTPTHTHTPYLLLPWATPPRLATPASWPRPLAVPRPPSEAEDAQHLATPTSLATPTGGSSAASPSGDSHAHLASATPTGPVFLGPRSAASPPSCLGSGRRACALLANLPPGLSRVLEPRLCCACTEGSCKTALLTAQQAQRHCSDNFTAEGTPSYREILMKLSGS